MHDDAESVLKQYYTDHMARHGDSPLGLGWPNAEDAWLRQRVMLDVIRPGRDSVTLLDFGCGTGHLLEHIARDGRKDIVYSGLDNSPQHIDICRRKFPAAAFLCADVLKDASALGKYDYVVINGLFNVKATLSQEAMFRFMSATLEALFPHVGIGMAFNVMSKHVDWERDDLFHVSFDEMAAYLKKHLGRHFQFRADYGLWEYTTYLYREPQRR